MNIYKKKEAFLLFLGDIFFFSTALWVTLAVRYLEVPSKEVLNLHIVPFTILFALWFVSFFIAGLYGKQTLLFRSRLPTLILNTQLVNSGLAVLFFYFIPFLNITPKVVLFIYLLVSFAFILIWRVRLSVFLGFRKKQKAILIGEGREMFELFNEVNNNPRYALTFVSAVDINQIDGKDFNRMLQETFLKEGISVVVGDFKNKKIDPFLPYLYGMIATNVQFVELHKVYTEIFDRVPLSILRYSWFFENVSPRTHVSYDMMKRTMDIFIAVVLGIFSFVLYPFVYLAIKLEDGGSIFVNLERVGKGNTTIFIRKFRTMTGVDVGEDTLKSKHTVTRVGSFLRKSRLYELPQLWNVIRGDISLIGPRPETPALVKKYQEDIPYYSIRHLIKPGLSGWAQIFHEKHPHHGLDVEETKNKLSYDLYYIKNRSLMLDVKIALLTIKTLLSRSGI